jgi:hypothetical protein
MEQPGSAAGLIPSFHDKCPSHRDACPMPSGAMGRIVPRALLPGERIGLMRPIFVIEIQYTAVRSPTLAIDPQMAFRRQGHG